MERKIQTHIRELKQELDGGRKNIKDLEEQLKALQKNVKASYSEAAARAREDCAASSINDTSTGEHVSHPEMASAENLANSPDVRVDEPATNSGGNLGEFSRLKKVF